MARLPLVYAESAEVRDWFQPADIREALRIQPAFVRPDLSSLGCTVLFTAVPGTIFLRSFLPRAIALNEDGKGDWGTTLCMFWACCAVLGLWGASFRNPGVVPRGVKGNSANGPWQAAQALPQRTLLVNTVAVKQRWCPTCRLYRPLRSKHCSQCDRCIFRFDHHCTWLGVCIGLNNYRYFLLLICSATLFYLQGAMITFRVLRHGWGEAMPARTDDDGEDTDLEGAMHFVLLRVIHRLLVDHGWEVVYFVYSLLMFVALFVLVLYHGIIIYCNLTTNEHVREYYLTKNPFDESPLVNCQDVFCSPYGKQLKIEVLPTPDLERAGALASQGRSPPSRKVVPLRLPSKGLHSGDALAAAKLRTRSDGSSSSPPQAARGPSKENGSSEARAGSKEKAGGDEIVIAVDSERAHAGTESVSSSSHRGDKRERADSGLSDHWPHV
eukprot:TRINITY_DN67009_c0_g1_i3.p1 TRINITY_DN67009_c0_g1~~TRINITY_DN67009_c0_g1_i3.p1  ORF type:complete len:440 (+),score=76.90 TRINITY_DN67009_c0_g1_i3:99-1418(+)